MLSISDLYQKTTVPERTLQLWAQAGKLPCIYRAGRVYIFSDAAIDVALTLRAKHKGKKGAVSNA